MLALETNRTSRLDCHSKLHVSESKYNHRESIKNRLHQSETIYSKHTSLKALKCLSTLIPANKSFIFLLKLSRTFQAVCHTKLQSPYCFSLALSLFLSSSYQAFDYAKFESSYFYIISQNTRLLFLNRSQEEGCVPLSKFSSVAVVKSSVTKTQDGSVNSQT